MIKQKLKIFFQKTPQQMDVGQEAQVSMLHSRGSK